MSINLKSAAGRRTQAERSSETKARLLDATIELLVEVGYPGTSTTEVVRRAGLSRGAQVHHFPRKLDLVIAAVEHLARRHSEVLLARMEALPEDETRTEVALTSLWEVYRSPLFIAAQELRVAARTDPEVREAHRRMSRTVLRPTMERYCAALAGSRSQDKVFLDRLEACFVFVGGLAEARQDRDSDWCERQIRLFSALMTPIIEDGRARQGHGKESSNP
jgi:AcrR family transcriptional regulator